MIYFSRNFNNYLIKKHIDQGGIAVVEDNGSIFIHWQNPKPLLRIDEIPITYGGKAACNIENSLAAISGLFAMGVPDHLIRLGLSTFKPDPEINTGRFNLFDMGSFQILLDYAHNPSGYRSVMQFVQCLNATRLVGIIGMPGDRMDRNIIEAGIIAGQSFSKIYIKEDNDLRGRNPGEVADLLLKGVYQGGGPSEDTDIILSERDALETAIYQALPGDLIVMFYEDFSTAYDLVKLYAWEEVSNHEFVSESDYLANQMWQ